MNIIKTISLKYEDLDMKKSYFFRCDCGCNKIFTLKEISFDDVLIKYSIWFSLSSSCEIYSKCKSNEYIEVPQNVVYEFEEHSIDEIAQWIKYNKIVEYNHVNSSNSRERNLII